LFHGGDCVGYVTSGGYAHFVRKSVALGYVPAMLARPEEKFEVEILGERRPARVQAEPLYDPSGSRMRS
jgi:dimethylglycine dehydrogenase